MLGHGIAVARVTVHAHALPVLAACTLVAVLAGPEVSFFVLEVSVHPDDGHGVGGVAVVTPDGSVAPFAHAVTDLG